jgi:hypothetical protein
VSSIVDFGVELFATAMLADPTSVALIFGTDTTAKVAAHRDALALRGVSPDRVVMKGCPKLATNIQGKGADSAEADALLGKFVHEAWTVMAEGGGLHDTPAGLAPVQNVYAGMCCTHYGYSLPLWNKALAVEAATGAGGIDTGVVSTCINPNSDMAGFIFKQGMRENAPSCEISIKVLSMVTLTTEIDSIAPLLSGPVRRRPHPPARVHTLSDKRTPRVSQPSNNLSPTGRRWTAGLREQARHVRQPSHQELGPQRARAGGGGGRSAAR